MSVLIRICMLLFLFNCSPVTTLAKETKYAHDSMTVSQVRKKVNFTVFPPKEIPNDWILDIRTYPVEAKEYFSYFRLQYMNSNNTEVMVSINQQKGLPTWDEYLSPNAERVVINGNEGYFSTWANEGELDKRGNRFTGGYLCWIQDGTYIEMDSARISKEQMVEIAKSMK
jgi:Domain of unknown function (DUF4367)